MALTDAQKIRLSIAVGHTKREPGWQVIRQFCLAEASAEVPEYEELKHYILGLFAEALSSEIQHGIDARS